jgi:LDH2 family malate/lactate/ureidoglycolate dehydrogenase
MIGCIGDPIILKQSPGTALVDGQNLLGPYVGKYCMNIAMEKAKNIGIGLVAARRSNHFGIAGYYSLKAVDKDLIGWAVCLAFFYRRILM